MKIFILKLWYATCIIFCLYNLRTLVDEERYEVAIFATNRTETDLFVHVICKELSSFKIKKSEIRLEKMGDELLNHFKGPFGTVSLTPARKWFLNRLETGQYLIFNDLLCIFNENLDRRVNKEIVDILSPPIYFSFRNNTPDIVQMTNPSQTFHQLIVKRRAHPYSNCSKNSRFDCLNECFKTSFRLTRYFYRGNETGLVHLSLSTNKTVNGVEKICLEKCWRENCEIVQFTPIPEPFYRQSKKREPKTTALEAQPKMKEFDFWVQFIGLVCSFANISLNQLVSMAIKSASSRVRRRKVRIGLFCLKWAILFLSLVCCGYLYTSKFLNCKTTEKSAQKGNNERPHQTECTPFGYLCEHQRIFHY